MSHPGLACELSAGARSRIQLLLTNSLVEGGHSSFKGVACVRIRPHRNAGGFNRRGTRCPRHTVQREGRQNLLGEPP
eukprot:7294349-Pyramimonas_sp.AAC.1